MGNSFGTIFRITSWGESHGNSLGVVVDGCPSGVDISEAFIQKELNRRRPGQSAITTPRSESDRVHIRSGVFKGRSTGMPIAMEIFNQDADSSKYEEMKDKWRPGHADFTYDAKYGIRDYRGSGRSSGRETVARVAAGAIARTILRKYDIDLYAFTRSIGSVSVEKVDRTEIEKNMVRSPDRHAAEQMIALIEGVKEEKDSIGGIVELRIAGLPPGLGEPVFNKFDAAMAYAIMGLGAVKGVEIGDGFDAARSKASANNDPYIMKDGKTGTSSNHAGGVLGGITTGEEFILRAAVKPPASIGIEQKTVTRDGKATTITVEGRHDPTIVPRIVPVVEAMAAIVVVDFLLLQKRFAG
ncbi:MAG: chorismate synthase [candidate division KSB1 bacterium]|jgi:chorismate synthase|nr:chorismate synthase [candidate division KSB1 bacterium]